MQRTCFLLATLAVAMATSPGPSLVKGFDDNGASDKESSGSNPGPNRASSSRQPAAMVHVPSPADHIMVPAPEQSPSPGPSQGWTQQPKTPTPERNSPSPNMDFSPSTEKLPAPENENAPAPSDEYKTTAGNCPANCGMSPLHQSYFKSLNHDVSEGLTCDHFKNTCERLEEFGGCDCSGCQCRFNTDPTQALRTDNIARRTIAPVTDAPATDVPVSDAPLDDANDAPAHMAAQPLSCENKCGATRPVLSGMRFCYCNTECTSNSNCCTDYQQTCVSGSAGDAGQVKADAVGGVGIAVAVVCMVLIVALIAGSAVYVVAKRNRAPKGAARAEDNFLSHSLSNSYDRMA